MGAKSRRKRALELPGDVGTRLRRQHAPIVVEQRVDASGAMTRRARVYSRNPLETYYRRGLIDEQQKRSGEYLGRLWQAAGMEPRIIGRYEEYVDAGRNIASVTRNAEAYQRWHRAVQVVGPVASKEVVTACCEEKPVGGAIHMEILRRGLDVLARHFGIS